MGERAGYRCRQGESVSPMLRKQWYVGEDRESIEFFVKDVAKVLLMNYLGKEEKIGSEESALRKDLNIDRLFSAMVHTRYSPPFDEICNGVASDISDHGVFEIELLAWDWWAVNHYPVDEMWIDEKGEQHTSEEVEKSGLCFEKMEWERMDVVREEKKMPIVTAEFVEGKMLDKGGVNFVWNDFIWNENISAY